jgi:hypothetical protein
MGLADVAATQHPIRVASVYALDLRYHAVP